MTHPTEEWVGKAEGDFNVVLYLRRSRKSTRHDAICFHCQQCVEKYLKARLNVAAHPIPKTHDLEHLLNLVLPLEPLWSVTLKGLQRLTDYAVRTRYPGNWATKKMAAEAFEICKELRKLARQSLGLK